jgi:peptide deformylase
MRELQTTKRGVVTDKKFLARRSEPAEPDEVEEIKEKLKAALDEQTNCLGLAAVQIGILKRVAIFKDGDRIRYLVNPKVVERSKQKEVLREGCMSMLQARFVVERAMSIRVVDSQNSNRYSGRMARVVLHEIDHMNGITIYDRYMEFKKHAKNRSRK